jgi:hypothetical protein
MEIHVYLLCYNESLIIKNVLKYYSTIATKIFVCDNLSSDNSVEIAKQFDKVTVIPFDTGGVLDDSMHVTIKTEYYKKYSREGGCFTTEVADWIITADMDEIIYHPDLHSVLREYKDEKVTVPQITAFDIVDQHNINEDQCIVAQYRKGLRTPSFDKRAVFDVNFDMSYSNGCHPFGPGFEYMKKRHAYKSSNKHKIALLHYKHIGTRLLDVSKSSLKRFDEKKILKDKVRGYKGPGAHYKLYAEKNYKFSPLLNNAIPLFDELGYVNFGSFEPATGEAGIVKPKKPYLSKGQIDFLRDVAIKVEKHDLSVSLLIMEFAKEMNPTGLVINRKVDEYKRKLTDL